MHDAFISYARRDSRDFVARLSAALEKGGKDVFVDLDDIPPASRWERDLQEGIAGSAVFVFVISPAAVESEHCRRELEHAREANKRIVPVAHLEVPDIQVPAAVGQLNWVPQQGGFEDDFDGSLAKLVQAIETDAEALRLHTRWQGRAEAWRDGNRARGLLATGAELREADAWLEAQTGRKPEPTPVQAEWVAAGRRQAVRRQRTLFGAAVIALLVSAILGILALIQRNEAVEQRDIARADELSSDSIANLESDPELSLILALEAAQTKPTDRSENTLRRALLASHVRARVESDDETAIDSASLSPDDSLVAIAIEDGTVRIADAETGEIRRTLDTGAAFASDAAFTPDGEELLTGDSDGRVITWSVADGSRLSDFQATTTALVSVDVSPDGKSVAVGADGGEAAIFNLDGGERQPLTGLVDRVGSVAFSPDSNRVVTASRQQPGGTQIWDARTGASELTLGDDSGQDANFSPSGKQVVTANGDGSASIWNASNGDQIGPALQESERGFITRVSWVPQGDAVITGAQGGDVTAWDVNSRTPIDEYRGHAGFILDVTTTADGKRLVTAGSDGTARVWDVGLRTASIDAPAATDLQFNPDSTRLLYAGGVAGVVDPRDGSEVGHPVTTGVVYGAAFSPDGTQFATAENDGRVEIFDSKSGAHAGDGFVQPGERRLFAVDWSADGSRLMAAGTASGVTVWNVEDGSEIGSVPVAKRRDRLFDAALSPDGTRVATISGGDVATISDVESGEAAATLDGHTAAINALAYDRSGSHLLTASADGTARIWDAETGEQLLTLNNDGDPVRAANFSGDGLLAVTTGSGGELRIWDASTGRELVRLSGVDDSPALNTNGTLVAAADTSSQRVSLYECEICDADLDRLQQLAEGRITREPTEQERALYLDR
jgi:WD40 repeat protein